MPGAPACPQACTGRQWAPRASRHHASRHRTRAGTAREPAPHAGRPPQASRPARAAGPACYAGTATGTGVSANGAGAVSAAVLAAANSW
jgi:hypothetical protein